MTTTDNLTAQIKTKVAPKKRGGRRHSKMVFDALIIEEEVQSEEVPKVDLSANPKRLEQVETIKEQLSNINQIASVTKKLSKVETEHKQMKAEFNEIILSLIDPLTKMNNFRKKFGL